MNILDRQIIEIGRSVSFRFRQIDRGRQTDTEIHRWMDGQIERKRKGERDTWMDRQINSDR